MASMFVLESRQVRDVQNLVLIFWNSTIKNINIRKINNLKNNLKNKQKNNYELKELTTFKIKIFTAIEILHKEKKKCPDAKSIFEYLKKNETNDISEKQVEQYLNQMINLNLIFHKKMNQGLDPFYKTTEKNDEIPLDLSYIT